MRTYFKTGYHHDIRLFADGRVAFRYAVLVALAAALPFALDDFLLGEVTNDSRRSTGWRTPTSRRCVPPVRYAR